ncbi:hypothetical protein TNCV_2066101 [Trichonephila clavipes]|nr:hypothetical protein TNCV_2066101 [Trichonephila clavipes]
MDGRSPSPRNSFTELYRTSTHAMIRRKKEMVTELKTHPPCTRLDCHDHKIPFTSVDEEINLEAPFPENKINSKSNKKKLSKKNVKIKVENPRKSLSFPKRQPDLFPPPQPRTPIETNNNFSGLEHHVEHPLSTERQVTTEVVTPKMTLAHPIMLKIKKNFRDQIKCISEKFLKIRNRVANDAVKNFSNDPEEYRALIHFLESDKEFEFYVINRKIVKSIKAVIKGLPSSSKINDITNDLADVGFQTESCTQLTSKRTKKPLSYFLVILPRNDKNSKIFDITKSGYLQFTSNLQSKITSIADVSCTPIGPPLPKSRPPLLTQVSKTMNIRVPDRGLKAAGVA